MFQFKRMSNCSGDPRGILCKCNSKLCKNNVQDEVLFAHSRNNKICSYLNVHVAHCWHMNHIKPCNQCQCRCKETNKSQQRRFVCTQRRYLCQKDFGQLPAASFRVQPASDEAVTIVLIYSAVTCPSSPSSFTFTSNGALYYRLQCIHRRHMVEWGPVLREDTEKTQIWKACKRL